MDAREKLAEAEAWLNKNKRWLIPVAAAGAAGLVGYQLLKHPKEQEQEPPPPPQQIPRTYVVLLDPGHGGTDPGATAWEMPREAYLNLDFAKYAARYFEQYGVRVEYTRSSDVSVALSERIAMACRLRPDAFVSIHFNAGPITAHGTEAIISSVTECPTDLSRRLAQRLVDYVAPAVGRGNRGVKTDCQTGQPCPFTILDRRGRCCTPEVPSAILEVSFITDPIFKQWYQTSRWLLPLNDSNYLMSIGKAIAFGTMSFLQTLE